MSPSSFARVALVIIFFIALAGGAVVNFHFHGPPVLDAASDMFSTPSLQGIREKAAQVLDLANREFIGKDDNANTRARIAVTLGKREMNNLTVIRGLNGHLYASALFPLQLKNARQLARTLERLTEVAAEQGTKVLYLSAPAGGNPNPEDIPTGLPALDFNAVIDNFTYNLREIGVPFVDSRFYYSSRGIPLNTISIRSGYLLTVDSVFGLHSSLLEGLERKYGISLDPDGYYRDRDNYRLTTYPKFFIGALGKATGPAFGGVDDFVAITPAFPTDFTFESLDIFDSAASVEGDAEATLLNPKALVPGQNLYNFYPDSFYRHAITTWSKTTNKLNPDKPRVLLVHDFFTAPLAGLLAPLCGELHTLSRQFNQTEKVEDYIKDKNFDCVIISFFPGGILEYENQRLLLQQEVEDEEEDAGDEAEDELSDVL